jgi:hypothetical protein
MSKKLSLPYIAVLLCLTACYSKHKQLWATANFDGGTVRITSYQKPLGPQGYELTIAARYELKKKPDAMSNEYFQYQLGKKMKLVVGKDTISPSLFYYLPLIREDQKEIDCRYVLSSAERGEPKRFIIDDSLFRFNQLTLPIQ